MSAGERASGRTALARDGFSELGDADRLLGELSDALALSRDEILVGADGAADPDAALSALARIARRDASADAAALHAQPHQLGEHAVEALLSGFPIGGQGCGGEHGVGQVAGGVAEHGVLVREVVVHRRTADPDGGGDLVDAHAVVAAFT